MAAPMASSLVTPTPTPSVTLDVPLRPVLPHQRPPRQYFPLLELPAETRLDVYRQLLPDVLEVCLCEASVAPPDRALTDASSSTTTYCVSRFLALESLIRDSGLVLLQVCTLVKNEILPLLNRLTVRFHCFRCLSELLANNSYGLGVGISWIKRIEVLATHANHTENITALFPGGWVLITPSVIRVVDRERAASVLEKTKLLIRMYYGSPARSPSEKWSRKVIPYMTCPEAPPEKDEAFFDGWQVLGGGEDGRLYARLSYPIQLPPLTSDGSIPPELLMPPPMPRCSLRDYENKWLITGQFDFEPSDDQRRRTRY